MKGVIAVINVEEVTKLHRDMVDRWHNQDVDNPHDDPLFGTICQQFQFNFLLWHEEDIARSPDVGDAKIAEVKRNIDGYNQRRNDWIEKIDDLLTDQLEQQSIVPHEDARQNTETVGSAIDRMSIMALRVYHMEEQLERDDATDEHKQNVERKLATCLIQLHDLSNSTQEAIDDIMAGEVRHKTYRQFKMYNDPALNPYLYTRRKAG